MWKSWCYASLIEFKIRTITYRILKQTCFISDNQAGYKVRVPLQAEWRAPLFKIYDTIWISKTLCWVKKSLIYMKFWEISTVRKIRKVIAVENFLGW